MWPMWIYKRLWKGTKANIRMKHRKSQLDGNEDIKKEDSESENNPYSLCKDDSINWNLLSPHPAPCPQPSLLSHSSFQSPQSLSNSPQKTNVDETYSCDYCDTKMKNMTHIYNNLTQSKACTCDAYCQYLLNYTVELKLTTHTKHKVHISLE